MNTWKVKFLNKYYLQLLKKEKISQLLRLNLLLIQLLRLKPNKTCIRLKFLKLQIADKVTQRKSK